MSQGEKHPTGQAWISKNYMGQRVSSNIILCNFAKEAYRGNLDEADVYFKRSDLLKSIPSDSFYAASTFFPLPLMADLILNRTIKPAYPPKIAMATDYIT